jgi:hypothetical protein
MSPGSLLPTCRQCYKTFFSSIRWNKNKLERFCQQVFEDSLIFVSYTQKYHTQTGTGRIKNIRLAPKTFSGKNALVYCVQSSVTKVKKAGVFVLVLPFQSSLIFCEQGQNLTERNAF